MAKNINVGLIGQRFMGRAHSNAMGQVRRFFELPCVPVQHTIAGRDAASLAAFAERWGWSRHTTRWQDLAENPEIDLVDIGTPNHMHREQALLMLEEGKHVCCEKPLAGTLEDARAMAKAAAAAKGSKTFVWFNYRRCPAIGLARKLVQEGRIGRIFHVRAQYLQSWGGAETEMSWRFQKQLAGSGAHGDLNAHLVDLARFLTGDEITEVHGAVARTFIEERTLPTGGKAVSDVDDALLFNASFKQGAVASFEASRLAGPHHNGNSIELNGELGSLRFEFEEMNVLRFSDASDGSREGGWRRIMCTSAGEHPYAQNWWPAGHGLGYEHSFTNHLADVMRSLGGQETELALPDFEDAYQTQRVLEAALIAARERRSVSLAEVQ